MLAVYEAVKEAVARARRGDGPTFVEAVTYRWGGHSMRANLPDYRTKEEEREWIERDPIVRFGHQVVEKKTLTPMRLKELEQAVELTLDEAVRFGTGSPEPTVEMMEASVYAPHAPWEEPKARGTRQLAINEALNEALHQEMARDSRVFVMGEDVGADRRDLPGHQGASRPLRRGSRSRHADLGGDLRRGRGRRGGGRHAPGGRDPDLGLHRDDHGPGREPGGEVPLHAGRHAHRARS